MADLIRYKILDVPAGAIELIDGLLESMGNGGCELCGVVNMKNGVKLIFKRPGESNNV